MNKVKKGIQVTVIIVTYNSEEFIKKCLQSILDNRFSHQFETIIVDNHSQDNTVNIIKRNYLQVILIENQNNLGFAKANNQALKIAKGEYIFLLNPDTIIEKDTLVKFYNYMENGSNKNIWCLGGQLVDENGNPSKSYGRFPNLMDVLSEQFGIKGIALKIFGEKWLSRNRWIDKTKKVPFIMGCNMFIRKDALDEIGHFSDSFFLNYEEVELSWRAREKGFMSVILPQVIIKHYSGKSFINLHEYLNHLRLGQVYFFKLTRGKIYFNLIKSLHLIGSLLRCTLKMNKKYLYHFRNIKAI